MNDGNFLKRFLNRLRRGGPGRKPEMQASSNGSPFAMLMQMISNTNEEELSCDEVFELLDQFSEMDLRGEDAARLMPMVQHHLEMCAGCREEFEALNQIRANRPLAG
jgi:hypothetical protein